MSIKFKKDKEQVLSEIQSSVHNSLFQIQLNANNVDSTQLQNHMQQLPWLISLAVSEAFRVMLENQYTDEDFEKDLGISEQK